MGKWRHAAAVAALISWAGPVGAQDAPLEGIPAQEGPVRAVPDQQAPRQHSWGALYPSLIVASEYRYDGNSNSSGEPVVQASLYWWRPDKTYLGLWASTVDFTGYHDPNTSYEIDLYAGRNWDFGGQDWYAGAHTRLTLEAMYTMFPDNETPGPTYDFLQLKARAMRRIDRWTLEASAAVTPQASYGAGSAFRYEIGLSYQAASWLAIGAKTGVRFVQRREDYSFWNIGATASVGQTEFDLRYYDTDLTFVGCGFSPNCGSALVGKLSWNLW